MLLLGVIGYTLQGDRVAAEPAASSEVTTQPAPADVQPPFGPGRREQKKRNWLVKPKAVSAGRDTEPPHYVRPLDQTGLPGTEELGWLDFGVIHRSRFERRDDNYIRGLSSDDFFFMRSRVYVGIREILDPLRLGFEFQNSSQFGSALPIRNQDVN